MCKTKLILAALGCGLALGTTSLAKTLATHESDVAFLAMAAQADMTMTHIGKMAHDRAAESTVKDFGNTLAADHTKDYQELTTLAMKTGDAIPRAIDTHNVGTITSLNHYKGRVFDNAFLERQISEHEKLVRAFRQEAEHGSNPAIKDYANKALPTIERHLHDAQDLIKRRS